MPKRQIREDDLVSWNGPDGLIITCTVADYRHRLRVYFKPITDEEIEQAVRNGTSDAVAWWLDAIEQKQTIQIATACGFPMCTIKPGD